MLITIYGTEWPILCWFAVKKVLTNLSWALSTEGACNLQSCVHSHGDTRLTNSYLLKGQNQPECQICHSPFTVKHILIHCTCLGAARQWYLATLMKMLNLERWLLLFKIQTFVVVYDFVIILAYSLDPIKFLSFLASRIVNAFNLYGTEWPILCWCVVTHFRYLL